MSSLRDRKPQKCNEGYVEGAKRKHGKREADSRAQISLIPIRAFVSCIEGSMTGQKNVKDENQSGAGRASLCAPRFRPFSMASQL